MIKLSFILLHVSFVLSNVSHGTGLANFLWKRAASRRSLTAVSTATDLYCVSERRGRGCLLVDAIASNHTAKQEAHEADIWP